MERKIGEEETEGMEDGDYDGLGKGRDEDKEKEEGIVWL